MNHIQNIEIKNFKSIRHQKIEDCRRVNVFIGYPNVGKSNILEAIGLYGFYQPSDMNKGFVNVNMLNGLGQICRVKESAELFYNHTSRDNIQILVNNKLLLELGFRYNANSTDRILQLRIGTAKTLKREGKVVGMYLSDTLIDYPMLENLAIDYKKINYVNKQLKFPILHVKKYQFSDVIEYYENTWDEFIFPLGNNIVNVLQNSSELRKQIASLLKPYKLKLVIENSTKNVSLLKELSDDAVVVIPYQQIADTLRRLIFFKTAIYSNKNSVLLFEEPEAHMFPPYISKLTSDIVNDENNNQFFLATHSPFVLNDLISNVEKDELSVYIVSYENETGETLIHRMDEEDVNEAYQYGYDFFMNINNFIPQKQHE